MIFEGSASDATKVLSSADRCGDQSASPHKPGRPPHNTCAPSTSWSVRASVEHVE